MARLGSANITTIAWGVPVKHKTCCVFVPTSNAKTTSKHCLSSFLALSKFPRTSRRRVPIPMVNEQEGKVIAVRAAAEIESMATEILGIKIVRNPPESKLTELGVRSWPKWQCEASKFPWTYSSKETCYLLKGKVRVYPDGSKEAVEVGAGDLVEFPKGMSCTWDVSEAVDKHYNFE